MQLNTRKLLKISTAIIALVGLIILAIPFVSSMKPSAAAKASLFEADISKLATGDFMELDDPYLNLKIFVIKDWDDSISAYSVPFRESEGYFMPDIHWYRAYNPCKNFGPEIEDGKLKKDGNFKCFDEKLSKWWEREYVWNYKGVNQGKYCADLPTPKYVIAYDTFKLIARGWGLETRED